MYICSVYVNNRRTYNISGNRSAEKATLAGDGRRLAYIGTARAGRVCRYTYNF